MDIAQRYEETNGPTVLGRTRVASSRPVADRWRLARIVTAMRTSAAFVAVAGAVALRDAVVASSSSTAGWACIGAALLLALVAKAAGDSIPDER